MGVLRVCARMRVQYYYQCQLQQVVEDMSEGKMYIPHLLLGLTIVLSVMVLGGMAVHHITGDILLSIAFPLVMFFVLVRNPPDES